MDRFIIKEFNCDSTWEWYVVIALESDMLEKIDWVCHWNFHFKKHEKKDVIPAKIMQPKLNRYDFWWFVLLCNILHNILYYTWRMCHFLVYFASLVGLIFNFRTGPDLCRDGPVLRLPVPVQYSTARISQSFNMQMTPWLSWKDAQFSYSFWRVY